MAVKARLQALREAKLTLGATLLIVLGLVAVAYVALGVSLLRSYRERDALSMQIASGEEVLASAQQVRGELGRLPDQLDDARGRLAEAEAAFPTELNPNEFLGAVLAHADEAGVRLVALDLKIRDDERAESGETSTYGSLGAVLRVEGSFPRLIELLGALEANAEATSVAAYAIQGGEKERAMTVELRTYARGGQAAPPPTPEAAGE